ncbi:MAG: hypothetical protein NTV22_18185 [bacterium]|nr:hypothetical protein [bacterium]
MIDHAGILVWKGDPEKGLQAGIELALSRARGEVTATNEARKVNTRVPEN